MPTNNFVPFCNENTGTNLPSQSAYLANPNLPIGNQPGIASSSLNNKALRQGTTMAAVLAQLIADLTGTDVLDAQNTADHVVPPTLLSQIHSALDRKRPVITVYTSSSGNHNLSYKFQINSGSATIGATYTNNGVTYTVSATVASALEVIATGSGAPLVSGTLTKTGGTGDATLTFNSVRAPLWMRVRGVGAGGGGGASGNAAAGNSSAGGGGGGGAYFEKVYTTPTGQYAYAVGAAGTAGVGAAVTGGGGGTGGSTTFGGTLTAVGGNGGGGAGSAANVLFAGGGAGGTASGGDINVAGQCGGVGMLSTGGSQAAAGIGGSSALGGGAGVNASTGSRVVGPNGGNYGGGGSGAQTVASTGNANGGSGAAGVIFVEEHYQ